jgi:hypothetical protein
VQLLTTHILAQFYFVCRDVTHAACIESRGRSMKYGEKRQPTSWSEREGLRRVEEKVAAQEVPKPYTVPEGYKSPTMGEQWLYATRRHPYYRYTTAKEQADVSAV